jgi:hypothetical protein
MIDSLLRVQQICPRSQRMMRKEAGWWGIDLMWVKCKQVISYGWKEMNRAIPCANTKKSLHNPTNFEMLTVPSQPDLHWTCAEKLLRLLLQVQVCLACPQLNKPGQHWQGYMARFSKRYGKVYGHLVEAHNQCGHVFRWGSSMVLLNASSTMVRATRRWARQRINDLSIVDGGVKGHDWGFNKGGAMGLKAKCVQHNDM